MLKLSAVEKARDVGSRSESLIGTLVLLALAANCAAAPGALAISSMTSTSPGGFVSVGTQLWVTDASAGFCQVTVDATGASQLQNCVAPPVTPHGTAVFGQPAFDGTAYVYLPDRSIGSLGIYRYSFDGTVFDPFSGFNVAPTLSRPAAAAIGSDGNLYVSMAANNKLFRITNPSGAVPQKPVGMGSALSATAPHGLAFVGSQLWIADGASVSVVASPLTCDLVTTPCTITANTQLGIASPLSIAVDTANNLVYVGVASGVYRNNQTTAVTDFYTGTLVKNGSPAFYSNVTAVGVDSLGNLYLVNDPTFGQFVGAASLYQVPAGSAPDGLSPPPQPSPLPPPTVVTTASTNPGYFYSSGLTTPKGAVWMGTHMWVVDHALGFCKVDLTLPPPSLTACAVFPVVGDVPGAPAFDSASNLLYISDAALGEGVLKYAFDPVSETLGIAATVVKDANLTAACGPGATAPTALALGPDGQLYVAMGGTSKILRVTAPSAATHVISVVGAMNNNAAANLAFYQADLYAVAAANVSIMRNATVCKVTCTAQALVAPLVTPASVAGDGNFIYIGDSKQVWKYDLVANTLTNLADTGLTTNLVSTPLGKIGGLAIDPLGQVYAADQGPLWQISAIKPTIASISPNQGAATTTQTVTITGTNFSSGTTVTGCSAVTASNVTFVSATQITADFAIGPGPLGSCAISVVTATGTSFNANFTVLISPPVLSTISPTAGFRGGSAANIISVTLTGINMPGATLSAGPDIAATVTSSTATQIVASFAISPTAALGPVNVTITTPSGTSNALAFTINAPAPLLTSIAPAQGTAATSVPVTFVGTALFGGTLNLPAGITLTGTPVVTPTSITATLAIASTIPTGPQSITVTTPGGTTNSVTFNILPVLTSIAPITAKAGTATAVTLTGTSLDTVTAINAGANITVTAVVATVNQITATFTTLNSAPLGPQSITVTNAGGTSNAMTFTITEPTPILAAIAPATGARGASVPVTLTGSGLVGATLNMPAGITLAGAPVVAFGQIAASFVIDPAATLGAQSITVTTPGTGGTSVAVTFTVFAPVPTLTSINPALGSAASSVPVTLAGTGLIDATLNLPAGITLAGAPVVTASSMTANLVISPAATGATISTTASISVTTPGGASNLLSFTIVPRALLSIAKTHIGSFTQAQSGAAYTVTVSNAVTSSPTIGPVTVTETVPSGLTLVSMTGLGWTCAGNTCTRADALAGGASYPAIAVTVNVSPVALSPQVNAITVSGGNSLNAVSTTDTTVINFLPPTLTAVNPALGVIGTSVPVTITGTNLTLAVVNPPAGVTATGVVVTASQITATLNIALIAPVGAQTITVTTPGGTTNAIAFTVLPLTPVLAIIAPASGVIGSSQAVTLTGTSLNNATLNLSAGITATGVVATSTQITATLVAAANAPLGPASLTVSTPGGTSNTITFTLVQSDITTQGTWKPVYGAGGQAIPNNVTNFPAYAQVAFTGSTNFTWSPSTADVRAPQKITSTGRIASAWYSFSSFSIDINLTDGLTHQVALYGLDWDGANTRAQRIDVLNPATGQVLATTPMTAFSAGQYLVWNLTGHVTLRVTRTAGTTAVVSGLFFDGGSPLLPALAAIAPATGVVGTTVPVTITGTNLIGANLNLGAGITATGVVATPSQITATLAIAATAPVGPQTISVTTLAGDSGTVTFTVLPLTPTLATIAPALGAAGTSVPVTLTGTNLTGATLTPGAGITATGVVATATQITATLTIAINAPLGPQSITVTTAGGTDSSTTFTVYQLAPVLASSITPATGVMGTTVPVTFTGTNLMRATLNPGAGITATGLVATPTQITANLVIAANAPLGPQTISVTTPGGTSNTATFSVVPAAATTDTITQGTWKPVYGASGQAVANDVTNYPAFAQVAFTGQTNFTWSPATTDVRGLQKGITAGRIASAWYSFTSFSIDINLTDGLAHQVALYGLDWDGANTRAQKVDVLNPATGQVLASSLMSSFSLGQYQVWTLSGHVTLRITKTGGTSAVVSGLFFDGGSALLPALAGITPATGVIGTTVPVTFTGTNLSGANLNLGAGITATGVVATASQVTASLAIAATVPVGPQTISVTTPGGDSGTVTFTVLPLTPTLATIVPATGATGTNVPVTLTGTNLIGANLNLGAGITATSVVATATKITATLNIALTAPLGLQSITATTVGGTSNAVTFTTFQLAPVLTSIAPATGVVGTTVPVTLTGTNLNGASLNTGAGITATGVVATTSQITATLAIAATAPVGPQTVSITTPGGTSGTVTFTVNPLAPTLAAVTPAVGVLGTSVPVTLTGTNLTGATLHLGAGVTATGVVVTATQITATLAIAATAPVGPQTITVTTAGGTTNAVTFTILVPVPVVATIAPATAVMGSSQPVVITGVNLNGAALNLRAGITATNVVATATQITATLVVAPNALLGQANFTVSTPGGISNNATFAIVPALAQTDTTTQGNWKPVYGVGGQAIANDVTNYPAYAQVALTGQTAFTWAATTADVRGLQKGAITGRIAASWYSFSSFSIDINLTDGLAHQVALYGLDWDGANTRAQRVDVLDPATGLVLASSPMSGFSAGQYQVWNLSGHVTLRVTRTAGTSAVVSGLFFDGGGALPALATITPAAGVIGTTVPVTFTGANLNGATLNLGAGITATGVVATASQITATLAIAATAPVGPQTISVTTLGGDSNTVTFTVNPLTPTLTTIAPALAGAGTTVPVTLTGTNLTGANLNLGAGITATSVVATATKITATFNIAATAPVGPQTLSVTTPGGTSGTVTFTVNPMAPTLATVTPAVGVLGTSVPVTLTGTNLTAATLHLGAGITATGVVVTATQINATLAIAATAPLGPQTISVTTPGGTTGTVTFTVNPLAPTLTASAPTLAATGTSVPMTLTGTNLLGASLNLGAGITANVVTMTATQITGTIVVAPTALLGPSSITVTTAGGTSNAATFTIVAPSGTAAFVKADTTTQGTWKTVYGADGEAIANDVTNYPAYAQVALTGQAAATWVTTTADVRGLQKGVLTGRIAATWFATASFNIDINLTDGLPHQVALYCLDWDAIGRAERIDVLDTVTGQVLASSSVSAFTSGQYLVWNLSGHVTLRVTKTAGTNAVVSGVFFK